MTDKKEKSVLTEEDRYEITSGRGYDGDCEIGDIIEDTERLVLANYKKGLREKVEKKTRIELMDWLLKELGEK